MDIQSIFLGAIQDGIREGIKNKLSNNGYGQGPFGSMIEETIKSHDDEFRSLLNGALSSAIGDPSFREEVVGQVRHKLASVLVSKFGGELEKQVNALRGDPATRARITLAIDEIVKR